jgi:type I restriction enzyme S subunit
MRTKNVQAELDLSDVWGIPEEFVKRDDQIIEPGDLLVSSANSWNLVGKCCWVPELPWRSTFGGFISVLRGDKSRIEPRYLYHWFSSPRIQTTVRSFGQKTTNISNLNIDRCLGLPLPLPPLPEQRRIAEILDKADLLRAKRRAALAQLDTLTQSIFLDMFGDPATNPKGWPMAALEEVFEIARGGSPRPIDDFITDDPDGINWIMIGDTVEGSKYITSTKKRIRPEGARRSRAVRPGDFLLTNSMSFGRPYILQTAGCIHDGWLVLSPRRDDVDRNYFYSLLSTRAIYAEFARRAPGATVKNLNIDLVRGVTVPVPPVAMQQQFARTVESVEAQATPFRRSLDEFEALFNSLQERAFSGAL